MLLWSFENRMIRPTVFTAPPSSRLAAESAPHSHDMHLEGS